MFLAIHFSSIRRKRDTPIIVAILVLKIRMSTTKSSFSLRTFYALEQHKVG